MLDYLQFVNQLQKVSVMRVVWVWADSGLSAATKGASAAANTSVKICLKKKALFECDLLRNVYLKILWQIEATRQQKQRKIYFIEKVTAETNTGRTSCNKHL